MKTSMHHCAVRALSLLIGWGLPAMLFVQGAGCRHRDAGRCVTAEARFPVAAVVTEYRHNSHADIIVSRLLQTHTLDGKGEEPALALASLFADQVPRNDTIRMLAASHRFPIFDTIADTLTLGGDRLAVNGVLLIAEHMMLTGEPAWPAERTLMTSGALDLLLQSRLEDGKRLPTPQLEFSYQSAWRWREPPPPPPTRPWSEQ